MPDDFLSQFRKTPRPEFADELYERISKLSEAGENNMSITHILPSVDRSLERRRAVDLKTRRHRWGNRLTLAAAVASLVFMAGIMVIMNRPSSDETPVMVMSLKQGDPTPTPVVGPESSSEPSPCPCPEVFEIKTGSFQEEIGEATSANIIIDLFGRHVTVSALEAGSDHLFEADVGYTGDIVFDVSGSDTKTIVFGEKNPRVMWESTDWMIKLSPDVPVDVTFNVNLGRVDADLSHLQLTAVSTLVNAGEINVDLPPVEGAVTGDFTVNAGELTAHVPNGATFDLQVMTVNAGSATVNIDAGATFDLQSFTVSAGSATVNVDAGATCDLQALTVSAGSATVDIGAGATCDLQTVSVNAGDATISVGEGVDFQTEAFVTMGELIFDVPDDTGVQINARLDRFSSLGLPHGYVRTHENYDNEAWESPGFADAETRIVVEVEIEFGTVTVQLETPS